MEKVIATGGKIYSSSARPVESGCGSTSGWAACIFAYDPRPVE